VAPAVAPVIMAIHLVNRPCLFLASESRLWASVGHSLLWLYWLAVRTGYLAGFN